MLHHRHQAGPDHPELLAVALLDKRRMLQTTASVGANFEFRVRKQNIFRFIHFKLVLQILQNPIQQQHGVLLPLYHVAMALITTNL